jgi:predicted CopG family antitoxin
MSRGPESVRSAEVSHWQIVRLCKLLSKFNLTNTLCDVHISGMGVRTISLKDEAYGRLKAARRYPAESFSEVVLRATWPEDTITGRALLALLTLRRGHLRPEELDRIESVTERDTPPEDKWAGS